MTVITAIISQKSFGPINSKCFSSGYFVLVAREQTLPVAAPTGYRPFRIIALFIVPNQSADISISANYEFLDPFLYPPLIHPLFALLPCSLPLPLFFVRLTDNRAPLALFLDRFQHFRKNRESLLPDIYKYNFIPQLYTL